jgi:hypothetical protein
MRPILITLAAVILALGVAAAVHAGRPDTDVRSGPTGDWRLIRGGVLLPSLPGTLH